MLFEPIQHGCQMNEAQEIEVALFVAGADSPIPFGPLKEILDSMALPVETSMPPYRRAPVRAWRNTTSTASLPKGRTKAVAVVALVGYHGLASQPAWPDGFADRANIGSLARRQGQLNHLPATVHPRREFGVQPALGATHGLMLLAPRRVAGVLRYLDVTGVQKTQRSLGLAGQQLDHARPQAALTPTAPASVHRTPRAIHRWQIAPRTTHSQHVHHGFDHEPMIFGRTPTPSSQRERYRRIRRLGDFFYPLPERIRQMKPTGFFHAENCQHRLH